MKPATPSQIKCIAAICQARGINKITQELMISGFTNQRTTSKTQLSFDEAKALIQHLQKGNPQAAAEDKMRKKILSIAHQMHWHKPGTTKLDYERINNWCTNYGHAHKKLDAYRYHELPKLVSQFEAAYKHHLQTI